MAIMAIVMFALWALLGLMAWVNRGTRVAVVLAACSLMAFLVFWACYQGLRDCVAV